LSSLYLYFFKQYKNIWKNLSLRIRIEILILFIIYFTFFSTRLINLFKEQLSNPDITEIGFVQFVLHLLILLISISIPFIHLNLIPRQQGIVNFRSFPLSKLNTFWLLFFLHYKYQLIGLILILPIFTAMLVSNNIFFSFYFLMSIILFQTIFILFFSIFSIQMKSKQIALVKYYILISVLFVSYYSMYFYTDYYLLYDPMFFIISLFYLILNWKNNYYKWDMFIESNQNRSGQKRNQPGFLAYSTFNKISFPKLTPLLAKEILNYLRNRKYIRIQIISFSIYVLILFYLNIKLQNNFIIYSSTITFIFIWHHFSFQFNEKYIKADSAVFLKTLPIKYYQLWITKFISEFIFVLIMLLFLTICYLFLGFQLIDVYQPLLVIILFSVIVLAAIINLKIIFFDRPRFAGYAYHFFIIFITVMSINYYLVGPIIATALLIYFTFYSYREFAR